MRFRLVQGVTADIADGSAIGLVGRSGSGKSTLAEMIAGLYPERLEASDSIAWLDPKDAIVWGDGHGSSAGSPNEHIQLATQTPEASYDERARAVDYFRWSAERTASVARAEQDIGGMPARAAYCDGETRLVAAAVGGVLRAWLCSDAKGATIPIVFENDLPCDVIAVSARGDVAIASAAGKPITILGIDRGGTAPAAVLHIGDGAPPATALGFSTDGSMLIVGDAQGGVSVWDIAPCKVVWSDQTETRSPISVVAAGQRTEVIAAGSVDGVLTIWARPNDGTTEWARTGTAHADAAVSAIVVDERQDAVFCGFGDGAVTVSDRTEAHLKPLGPKHETPVVSIEMHPEHPCLVSRSADGVIRSWRTAGSDDEPADGGSAFAGLVRAIAGPRGGAALAGLIRTIAGPQGGSALAGFIRAIAGPRGGAAFAGLIRTIAGPPGGDLLMFRADGSMITASLGDAREGHWPFPEHLLEHVGIGSALGRLVGQLSDGQRVRFDLVRALLHEPRLLIADEPFTTLDPVTRDDLCHVLLEHNKSSAIIYISHETDHLLDVLRDLGQKGFSCELWVMSPHDRNIVERLTVDDFLNGGAVHPETRLL